MEPPFQVASKKKTFLELIAFILFSPSNDTGGLDTRKRQMDELVLIGVEPRMDPPEIQVSKRTLQRFKLFLLQTKRKRKRQEKGKALTILASGLPSTSSYQSAPKYQTLS